MSLADLEVKRVMAASDCKAWQDCLNRLGSFFTFAWRNCVRSDTGKLVSKALVLVNSYRTVCSGQDILSQLPQDGHQVCHCCGRVSIGLNFEHW